MAPRRILFDTQLLIWAAEARPELPRGARDLLLDAEVAPVVSAASIWEIAIKSALGRADFNIDADALSSGLRDSDYEALPIDPRHAAAVSQLPFPGPKSHRDPFKCPLLTDSVEKGHGACAESDVPTGRERF